MCHMMADTHEELMAMARHIGVAARWLQHAGTPREHFDICKSKRAQAVAAGAKEVDARTIVQLMRDKQHQRRMNHAAVL